MEHINLIESQLIDLKLAGIRSSLSRRLAEASEASLSHTEFLNLVLQDEITNRKNARIERLQRSAGFRSQASCEGIDFAFPRGLSKKVILDVASGTYIDDGRNILILGPTGVGKTHIATAIGNTACRNGRSVLFLRMNTLIERTALSRAQGTWLNYLRKLAAPEVLILDDFGIKPLTPQQFQDLYDVIDERGEGKSIIITSQVPVNNWSEVIADPVVCEAISDRIVHKSQVIQMKGESYRKNKKNNLTQTDPL
jgi:DNA replication protein DnaC